MEKSIDIPATDGSSNTNQFYVYEARPLPLSGNRRGYVRLLAVDREHKGRYNEDMTRMFQSRASVSMTRAQARKLARLLLKAANAKAAVHFVP